MLLLFLYEKWTYCLHRTSYWSKNKNGRDMRKLNFFTKYLDTFLKCRLMPAGIINSKAALILNLHIQKILAALRSLTLRYGNKPCCRFYHVRAHLLIENVCFFILHRVSRIQKFVRETPVVQQSFNVWNEIYSDLKQLKNSF